MDEEIAEVVDTLKSNWITTGPKTKLFENNFAQYIGASYALAVNSGTSGLHLALESIGLKAGEKVITTPYTFTATAEVIAYFKADPIFIDIERETFNIDPKKIRKFCEEECIVQENVLYHQKTKSRIRAIMPVHFAGKSCDMDAILSIAQQYHLNVIEDAAHALPSFYKHQRIGTLSDITVFSFYATKPITTGEGGMVVTRVPHYYERMKTMSLHGIDRDAWDRYLAKTPRWYYEVVDSGFKYNMTDIAASLGIHQLKKVDIFHQKRKWIASLYHEALSQIPELELPAFDEGHAWHLYVIQLNSKRFSRDEIVEKLFQKGIGVSVHFIPLHMHPYYRNKYHYTNESFPVAYDTFKKVISLPIYTKLTEGDIERITGSLKELFL